MKYLVSLWIIVSWLGLNAQPMEFDSSMERMDVVEVDSADTTSAQVKMVDFLKFDTALIPCSHIYDYSWDSLHLDKPCVRPSDTSLNIILGLVENECGYHHPCDGPITSNFGWRRYRMHKGIDIDLNTGDPVYAAFDGVVRIAKYNYGGFGNYVVIRHYNGLETLYGHLSARKVVPNQTVTAGQVIGLGGNTGRSTGSHLHFEVLYRGTQLDPNTVISFKENELKSDSLHLTLKDFKNTAKTKSGYTPSSRLHHRIRSGDSLWRISRRYGTSIDRLCRLNGISRNSTLRIGKSIRVR